MNHSSRFPSVVIDVVKPVTSAKAKLDFLRSRKRRTRTVPVRSDEDDTSADPLSAYMVPAKYLSKHVAPKVRPSTSAKTSATQPATPVPVVRYSDITRPVAHEPIWRTRLLEAVSVAVAGTVAMATQARMGIEQGAHAVAQHSKQAVAAIAAFQPFTHHASHSTITYSLSGGVSVAPSRRTTTWFLVVAGLITAALIIVMWLCNTLLGTYFSTLKPAVGAAPKHTSTQATASSRPSSSSHSSHNKPKGQALSPTFLGTATSSPTYSSPTAPTSSSPMGITFAPLTGGKGGGAPTPSSPTTNSTGSLSNTAPSTTGDTTSLMPSGGLSGSPTVSPGLPTTVTVPGADLSAGDKPVLSTSGTSLTLN